MRTYAAHKADLERLRYADKAQYDPTTVEGAKAVLANRDANIWARQLIARIHRNGVAHYEQTPIQIVTALETLGLIKKQDPKNKTSPLVLTGKGEVLAAQKKTTG